MTPELERELRRNHKWFYCPAGHQQHFVAKSDVEKLREELDDEARRRARLTSQLDQAQAAERNAKRRVIAMKGVVTKTKKRIAAGVCVRCSAKFPDLEAHMAEEHPGYAPEG